MSESLGDLETLILLATLRLGEEAYGVSIRDEIAARTGRRLTRGAIYTALRRLGDKKLLEAEVGSPTPIRGGRAKRFFTVSAIGMKRLRNATTNLDRMREGMDALLLEG